MSSEADRRISVRVSSLYQYDFLTASAATRIWRAMQAAPVPPHARRRAAADGERGRLGAGDN